MSSDSIEETAGAGTAPPPRRDNVWYWGSLVVLAGLLALYLGAWVSVNREGLFDPLYQNDDVRQHVMPMHRYDGHHTLADDPVALNMLAMSTLGIRMLYMILTPTVGIYMGAKVVQFLALALIAWSLFLMVRSKRCGPACAALVCFFVFHTETIITSVGSGVQRSFGIPFMVLWTAGALTESRWTRYCAILFAALTYPPVMLLILASEGMLLLRDGVHLKSSEFRKGIIACVLILVGCIVILRIDGFTKPERGGPPSLKEAEANPVFGQKGRTKQIPLKDPGRLTIEYATDIFAARALRFRGDLNCTFIEAAGDYRRIGATGPLALMAVLFLVCLARACPRPAAALALLCGTQLVHLLAREFVFKLYIPHRYLFYGMSMAAVAFAASVVGLVGQGIKSERRRAAVRNTVAACVIVVLVVLTGDHLPRNVWLRICRGDNAELWDCIGALPGNVRIAVHPKDGDGISYWTGRAATPGHEQLVPWSDIAWEELRLLEEDTLRALYARDRGAVLDFCGREGISHLLINTRRYRAGSFVERAHVFEPLSSYTDRLLADVDVTELVLGDVPDGCVLFRTGSLILVEVKKLRAEWAGAEGVESSQSSQERATNSGN